MKCRNCGNSNLHTFADLGSAPPSNSYLSQGGLRGPEKWFPLRVFTCFDCWLVQTEDFAEHDELFSDDYAYFSSYSTSWLEHSKKYVSDCIKRFGLNSDSHVVEVAANDGYLLQYVKQAGIPCLGVEPTKSTADAARAKGIEIVEEFFGEELGNSLAERGYSADLTAANNVLAHVPNIRDFAKGFAKILKPHGVATFEFPHLLNLVKLNQFDTIYHEHFSYLSLTSVESVFENAGLSLFDVERLPTHGGSLRIFAQRADTGTHQVTPSLVEMQKEEADAGMNKPEFYAGFQTRCETIKYDLLKFLINAKTDGKKVIGYGAAAKGNTLMNFSGVRPDLLSSVIDKNPAKQGKFMPGSRIPIVGPDVLETEKPDFVFLLPWNLLDEVKQQLKSELNAGAKLVVAVPELTIVE